MSTTEEMAAKRLKTTGDVMDVDPVDPVPMDDDDPPIYIAVRRDCCAHDWYVFTEEEIVEIKDMSSYDDGINNLRFGFACTLMKAKLYMIGGRENLEDRIPCYTPPLDDVLVFDLTAHPRKWRYGLKMHTPRTSPTVVRHNKGIYVFGGGRQVLEEYWAEYLSEEPGSSWVKLPQPPKEITDSRYPFYKASGVAGGNIILWNRFRFILFDAVKESWHTLQVLPIPVSFPVELYLESSQMVCVNDSLFWCCVDMVRFDFLTRTPSIYNFDCNLNTPWPSFQSCRCFLSLPHLFATKTNALSLIWSDPADELGYIHIMYNNIHISASQSITPISLTKEFKVPGDRIYYSVGRKSLNASADLSISDPLDFLATLHRKIIAINFNLWALETQEPLQLVESDESDELILVPRKVYPDMDTFLKDLGLEEYSELFKREEIDLSTLKLLTNEHFAILDIPLAHRQKLRQGLANL